LQGRRRDEPFNPFAPGARNKRKSQRDRAGSRTPTRGDSSDGKSQSSSDIGELRKKALKEMKKKAKSDSTDSSKETPGKTVRKEEKPAHSEQSREDRLAELRRKSAASVKVAEEVKKSSEEDHVAESEPDNVTVEDVAADSPNPSLDDDLITQDVVELEPIIEIGTEDVFKQIKTVISKPKGGKRRSRRDEGRGGGRQPKTRKLDRRKYLEYKYVVREILDDENIAEEQRSNLLGQIWAKGERMGIEESIAFIDQKVLENIIPQAIAEELQRLVKKYTTKR